MSASTKWPDFQLASKLRFLMGTQPSAIEATTADNNSSSSGSASPELAQHTEEGQNGTYNISSKRADDDLNNKLNSIMLADAEERPLDGLQDYDGLHDEHDAAHADADFGDLEMFDSTASQAPFLSQIFEQEAAMETALAVSAKDSKREKKKKNSNKKKGDPPSSSAAVVEESPDKKRKKAKSKSLQATQATEAPEGEVANESLNGLPTSPTNLASSTHATQQEAASSADALDSTIAPSTQSKKKRKLSDSAGSNRKKKRKAHEEHEAEAEVVIKGTQYETAGPGLQAASFLRKEKGLASRLAAAVDEDTGQESATPNSPSAARLRRRSHSREARSRRNSVSVEDGATGMDINAQGARNGNSDDEDDAPSSDEDQQDDDKLAREAWTEHGNTEGESDGAEHQAPGSDDGVEGNQGLQKDISEGVHENGSPEEIPADSSTMRRSTRKKAKPTYFEQPSALQSTPGAANRQAFKDLPSPSAMTPKSKAKGKRAVPKAPKEKKEKKEKKAKKEPKPKLEKLSQSMRGGSGEAEVEMDDMDYEEAAPRRRGDLSNYTQGRFTDDELARIRQAVESFRVEYGLNQFEVNEIIQAPGGTSAGDVNNQLWIRLVAECPDRKRQKVINIARKKFHNFVARGTWTAEQDAELTELYAVHGAKWSKIAGLINRHPEDVRDRHRNYLVCGDNQRKDTWSEAEEALLTQFIMEAVAEIDSLRREDPNRQLLQMSYEELINWQDISSQMNRTRSRLQCITKWKSLNIRIHGKDKAKLAAPDSSIPFRLEKARLQLADLPEQEAYRLILGIQQSPALTDNKIPWHKLLDKTFRNTWHRTTQVLFWNRVKRTVPDWESKSVREITEYLMDYYNNNNELPDYVFSEYDDELEMQILQLVPSSEAANGDDVKGALGQVHEAVMEAGEHQQAQNAAEGEMQIDPALTEEPRTLDQATPAKKTRAKKQPSTKRAKKSAIASQDPIEEADPEDSTPAVEDGEESNLDENLLRKKKTPSRFKKYKAKKPVIEAPERAASEDSVMDDMGDIPAKVAV